MISPLLHRLFEGADTRSLAHWISRERTSHFGAGPDDARDMRLAESLTAWWKRRRAEASWQRRTRSGCERAGLP